MAATIRGGALLLTGKLIVTRRMFWGRAGSMLGTGGLVIALPATGTIAAGNGAESAPRTPST